MEMEQELKYVEAFTTEEFALPREHVIKTPLTTKQVCDFIRAGTFFDRVTAPHVHPGAPANFYGFRTETQVAATDETTAHIKYGPWANIADVRYNTGTFQFSRLIN